MAKPSLIYENDKEQSLALKLSAVQLKPFVFDKGGFRNGSQTIVIDFNEAVRARCGKFYSYEQLKNEIIPFEIEHAKTPYGKINGGPPYWLAGPSAYTATKYIVGTLDCGVDASAGFEGVLRKPPFDSFEALINSVGLVPYNDKKSEQLILCNNFEQEIDGAWEVTLYGNPNGLATALDMLSKSENVNPVLGLMLRKGDRFAWIPYQLDISRHTFYEQQSTSPVANEAPKLVNVGEKLVQTISSINDEQRPWTVRHTGDPEPALPWYTPARYFARQFVGEDPSLILKRDVLCNKIATALPTVGVYKRGGVKPLDAGTIRKALTNINF